MAAPYATERAVIDALLASWTASPVWLPNTTFTPPAPSSNPAAPACYLALEIVADSTEQTDMAGGFRVDGRVELGIWVEKGVGDGTTRAHLDALFAIFRAGDGSGLFFLEPLPPGDPVTEGDWYGRPLSVPFVHLGNP